LGASVADIPVVVQPLITVVGVTAVSEQVAVPSTGGPVVPVTTVKGDGAKVPVFVVATTMILVQLIGT